MCFFPVRSITRAKLYYILIQHIVRTDFQLICLMLYRVCMLEAIELALEAAEIIQMTTRRRRGGTGMKTTQSNNPSGK